MKYGKKEDAYRNARWAKFIGLHCDPVIRDGWTECEDPGFNVDHTFYTIDLAPTIKDYKKLESLVRQKQVELNDLKDQLHDLTDAIGQNVAEPTICNGYFLNWTEDYFQITKGKMV